MNRYWAITAGEGDHIGSKDEFITVNAEVEIVAFAVDKAAAIASLERVYGPSISMHGWGIDSDPISDFVKSRHIEAAEKLGRALRAIARDVGSISIDHVIAVFKAGHLEDIRIQASEGAKIRVLHEVADEEETFDFIGIARELQLLF